MGLLQKIFSKSVSDTVTSLGNVVDKFVTTKGEKEKLKQEMLSILQDHEFKMQDQLTERQRIDMASDSWLSKNIRPMTLIFMTVLMTTLIVWDSASVNFLVDEAYITMIKVLLVSVFMFYFGGREIQKAIINYGKK